MEGVEVTFDIQNVEMETNLTANACAPDAENATSQDLHSMVLQQFVSRLDKRLKDIAELTITMDKIDAERAKSVFKIVANALAPQTPQTVITTTAEWCAKEVQERSKRAKRNKKVNENSPKSNPTSVDMNRICKAMDGESNRDEIVRILHTHGIQTNDGMVRPN